MLKKSFLLNIWLSTSLPTPDSDTVSGRHRRMSSAEALYCFSEISFRQATTSSRAFDNYEHRLQIGADEINAAAGSAHDPRGAAVGR